MDAETHIIVAADLTNWAEDWPDLGAVIEQTIARTGRRAKELSADTGY